MKKNQTAHRVSGNNYQPTAFTPKSMLVIVLLLVCLVVSALLNSRAFVIGYLSSLTLLLFMTGQPLCLYRWRFVLLTLLLSVFFFITFYVKSDSTAGRLLIYKLSWGMLSEHFPSGTGISQFAAGYKSAQAFYFSQGNYTTQELLLADNTSFAFNDHLQWVICTGVWGLFIWLPVIALLSILVRHAVRKSASGHPLVLFFAGQLITIFIAAFFTHVLEKPIFQFLSLLCILTLCLSVTARKYHFSLIGVGGCCALLLFFISPMGKRVVLHNTYHQYEEAKQLLGAGYNTEAALLFDQLSHQLSKDPRFLFDYMQILHQQDSIAKAIQAGERLILLDNNSVYLSTLAALYAKTGAFERAIQLYRQAIFTVPNRFTPRFQLFNLYCQLNNDNEALQQAQFILQLPVKIPSREVLVIKDSVQSWLARKKQ